MTDELTAFLAGERPEDVVIYLSEAALDDPGPLEPYGERVEGGLVLVVDGERGRDLFGVATGVGAMEFAGAAMKREGRVDPDLTGGDCPDAGDDTDEHGDGADRGDGDDASDHDARFLLAFAEAERDDADDRYGEGDVVHAYVQCDCGTAYSQRWVAGER